MDQQSSPTSSSSSSSDMSPLSSFPLLSWLSRSCFLLRNFKFSYSKKEKKCSFDVSHSTTLAYFHSNM